MSTDPLKQHTASQAELQLFEKIGKMMQGVPLEVARSVAANLLINAIRMSVPDRKSAEAAINEIFGRAKTILLEAHYDSVTGRRRSVFPFPQVIEPSMHIEKDKVFQSKKPN